MRRDVRAGVPLAATALAGALLTGCSGDDGPAYALARVGRASVTEVVEAPGSIQPRAAATVTSPADGSVAVLAVGEGQQVRAGQVLMRLSSPSAVTRLREARRADAQAADAGDVSVPSSGIDGAQRRADLAAARAFVAARRAAAAIPDPVGRARALTSVAAAEAQYAAASAQAEDAVRRFDAGIGSLADALGSLGQAQRVQTRAAVAAAEQTVDALVVRAPITGVVDLGPASAATGGTDLSGALGQLPESVRSQASGLLGSAGGPSAQITGSLVQGQPVSTGQPLVAVTDTSSLSVAAEVDETDVLLVRRGVAATVELDAVPDATYDATVTAVEQSSTTSQRGGVAYVVRLALSRGTDATSATAPQPRPGMSAVVSMRVREAKDAIALPPAAIVRDGRSDAVWVESAGRARKRPVRLGAQGESVVQVVSGLREGERVVVRGADRIRAGQRLS